MKQQQSTRVLLVEDNEADAILLQYALKGEGVEGEFEVKVASTLREAKTLLTEEMIDVVLLDLSLPDSRGVETVRALKGAGESVPFIVLSGLDDDIAAFESIRAEAQDYLVKGQATGKQLEQSIYHAIERQKIQNTFREALVVAADSIVIFNLEGEVLFSNQSALNLSASDLEAVFEKETANGNGSNELTLQNGTVVETRTVGLVWDRRPALFCSLRDITVRKRAAQQLQELQARALQSQRLESLGTLAGGVAHEFNNLLTGILGNSDLLAQDWVAMDEVAEIAREIRQSARRAAKLTKHLLGFARKGNFRNERVDLHQKIKETKELLLPVLRSAVTVEFELKASNPTIECDPDQLNQVLLNLALNGQDAMKNGGTLTFRTAQDNLGRLAVEICDQGEGIPEQIQSRIFDPFFTTKPQDEGTGMGLAMVWGTANQNGWDLDFKTKQGEGTCFRIAFPVLEAQSAQGTNGKILVIEKDNSISTVLKRFLQQLKFEVHQVKRLEGARTFLKSHEESIDVVVADIESCETSADSLLTMIRDSQPQTSIILMTGDATTISDVDPDGYLFKPFDFRMLASTLHQSLSARGHKALADLSTQL